MLPTKGSPSAAGYDLKAKLIHSIALIPGVSEKIYCGVSIEIPEGYFGLVAPRSGMATKHNVTIINAPGIIDSDYRGELSVTLINNGNKAYLIEPMERIGQLLILPVENSFVFVESKELSDTTRGTSGFGSSGRV